MELEKRKTESSADVTVGKSDTKNLEEKKTRKLKKENSGKRSLLFGIIISLIIAVIIVLVVFGFGIYKYKWENSATKWMIKYIPYPAAMVDFDIIRYSVWQEDVDTLNFYIQKQTELNENFLSIPEDSSVEETVIDKMIRSKLLSRLVVTYDIEVTDEDINKELEVIYTQAPGGQAEVEQTLRDLYDWSIDEFKDNVIVEFLIREKVATALNEDPEFDKQAKEDKETAEREALDTVNTVLEMIKSGEMTFEDAAKEYSQDPGSAEDGGNLGEFGLGEMVPEFEIAAFALEKDQISDVVQTDYGYHIIQVTDKRTDEETEMELVTARHILIMPQIVTPLKTLDQLLTEMQDEAKVYDFVSPEDKEEAAVDITE